MMNWLQRSMLWKKEKLVSKTQQDSGNKDLENISKMLKIKN